MRQAARPRNGTEMQASAHPARDANAASGLTRKVLGLGRSGGSGMVCVFRYHFFFLFYSTSVSLTTKNTLRGTPQNASINLQKTRSEIFAQ